MFKQELINLGYKIIKERDVLALEFESEVLNGFKLRGNTYIYDEDSKLGFKSSHRECGYEQVSLQ